MNFEQLLLLKLMEECTEVAKEAAKCMQFGMDEVYEPIGKANRERLADELNDVMAIIQMLNNGTNLRYTRDEEAIKAKIEKVLHYAQYSADLGKFNIKG